jgi:hypothetical protein
MTASFGDCLAPGVSGPPNWRLAAPERHDLPLMIT